MQEVLSTPTNESATSAVSWSSIIGGALALTAVTIILVAFGGALGLAPTSPPDSDRMGMTMTAIAAIWLIVTQWIASAIGGYLTGRLRARWVQTHTHEVFFRDTAHGFLAWAAAMIFGLVVLTSVASHMMGYSMQKPDSKMAGGPVAYYVDSLYRAAPATPGDAAQPASAGEAATATAEPPAPSPHGAPDARMESARILTMDMHRKSMPASDQAYLTQLVAAQTGLSQADATQRVTDVMAQAKDDMQKMRKAASLFSLFTGLSMLVGAFIAAAAAAFGGSQRDEWEEAVRNGTYRE